MTAGVALGLGTGGIGTFIGSLFGYKNAKKNQDVYNEQAKSIDLIKKAKQEVLEMTTQTPKP